MIPALIVLREDQIPLARRVAGIFAHADIHGFRANTRTADHFFDNVPAHLVDLFLQGRPIIAIASSGIVIRALAPILRDKHTEPPVLSLSDDGSSVVPLLGGHHGANDMARKISESIGSHAAITTASDLAWRAALDEPPLGLRLANPDAVKKVVSGLLNGKGATVSSEIDGDFNDYLGAFPKGDEFHILISHRSNAVADLLYRPANTIIGIGCERHCAKEEIVNLVEECLTQANIAKESLAALVSIDLKENEVGIHEAAAHFGVPARFFSKDELARYDDCLMNPSEVVFREVGVRGVAEGAVLAALGQGGQLLVEKQIGKQATASLGRSSAILDARTIGRKQGRLTIIGIGPGRQDWRVAEAETALRQADAWVGYRLYLDLLPDMGKTRHAFELGEEEKRVRFALEMAATGREVALISSGDAGIYAMASLACELIDGYLPWQRLDLQIVPGISAMQAAAARAGAPLGHDFCAISLSDLLTPWPIIEKRLRAAGEGDFVIAFYNPVSGKRHWQLGRARELLLVDRSPGTPVLIARNLGRDGETLFYTSLHDLDPSKVDMLSLVLIGNSQSKVIVTSDRRHIFYTPRGYAAKFKGTAS